MDALEFISGGLGIAGNIASTLINNHHNEQLIQEQNRLNLEQWNRENLYNSPAEQMKRLKAAGLNPNLIYGNGAGSLLSAPSPTMQASRTEAPQIDPLTAAQIANLNAQTEATKDANIRENQKQPLNLKNLVADVDLKTSQVGLNKSASSLNSALQGESKQRAENLLQQWQQSNERFNYDLEILKDQSTITKETALRTARQLEAAISNVENLAKYYDELGKNVTYDAHTRRISANSAANQAATASERLAFDKEKWDDGQGNGELYLMKGDLALKMAQMRKAIASTIRDMQEADVFDETKLVQVIKQYTETIGALR